MSAVFNVYEYHSDIFLIVDYVRLEVFQLLLLVIEPASLFDFPKKWIHHPRPFICWRLWLEPQSFLQFRRVANRVSEVFVDALGEEKGLGIKS